MRRAILATAIFLPGALSALAQERPRFFDNFDTNRGVQVRHEKAALPVISLVKTKTPAKLSANTVDKKFIVKTGKSLPVASSRQTLARQPRTVQMSAGEGLAEREMANYASSKTPNANGRNAGAGLNGFTTGNVLVDSYIVDSSRRYGIDPLLIYSQMHQESTFKSRAISPKGARGLMQLMPGTARRFGVENIFDVKQNKIGRAHV